MPKNTASGTNISFEIRGYNRVRNNLRKVIAAHPKDVDSVMGRWAKDTRMFLKRTPYPSKPAGSRYQRTGKLASSWKAERLKAGVWGITNNASNKGRFYARYVVGSKTGKKNERQTLVHRRHGWWRADEVVENVHIPELRIFLEDMYVKMWNE